MFRPDLISTLTGRDAPQVSVEAIESCPSTNTLLLEQAAQGAPSGRVLVAEKQTAGRGRLGRSWLCQPGKGLAFSYLHRRHGDASGLAGLSLAAGVAVAEALEQAGAADISLKWPNDVLFHGKKLAGILVETTQSKKNGVAAVIGIGLNLAAPGQENASGIAAAGLAECCPQMPEPNALLAGLAIQLFKTLARFDAGGFAALQGAWQARNAWQGKPVRLMENGKAIGEGDCLGVDGEGALLLQSPSGTARFLAGDLSLRQA
jgi:BirA family biotin operon repressor/biotin-[acetyl-CoA-carboxylase] ligase